MKKYSPSGYQIITVDGTNYTEPTSNITSPTEDEKILIDILKSGEVKKPVLLTIKNIANNKDDISGFCTLITNKTSISTLRLSTDTYTVDISYNRETQITSVIVSEN